jgi:hypothetical protein
VGTTSCVPAARGFVDPRGDATYIVDSGTSNLLLLDEDFRAVKAGLIAAAVPGSPPPTHGFWNASSCATGVDLARFPPLDFSFTAADGSGDVSLRVEASRYTQWQYGDDGIPCAYLLLGPIGGPGNGIIGQPLFEAFYVVHDQPLPPARPTIGFAPIAGCGDGAPDASTAIQSLAVMPQPSFGVVSMIVGLQVLLGVAVAVLELRRRRDGARWGSSSLFWAAASAPLLEE